MEGVELEFRPEALAAIARKALKRKTGARGLRTIVESVLLDTMYELPSLENVSKVVVDDSVIDDKAEPYLIYRGNLQQQRAGRRSAATTPPEFASSCVVIHGPGEQCPGPFSLVNRDRPLTAPPAATTCIVYADSGAVSGPSPHSLPPGNTQWRRTSLVIRQRTPALDPLPVLPLRDVVVFPHMVIPLFVGRDKSIRALEQAMEGDKQILLVAQKSPPRPTIPAHDDLLPDRHARQRAAAAEAARRHDQGAGRRRCRACRSTRTRTRPACSARRRDVIEPIYSATSARLDVVSRSLMSLFEQYVKTNRKLPPELLPTLSGIDDPSRLADTIAAHLRVRMGDKQQVLETADVGQRLELLVGLVDGEIDVQQIEKRIRGRVKSQMEKSQREYYLNEQMKAIQKELGEIDEAPNDIDELHKKIADAGMPKPVQTKAAPGVQQAQADVADVGRSHGRAQLPRLAARRAVEEAQQGPQGSRRSRRRCSTPITSAWRRSRNASSSTSRCSRA